MPGLLAVGGNPGIAPYAPILGTPADLAYEPLNGTPTFTWTYLPGSAGATQTSFVFRMKQSGGGSYVYWNSSAGKWSTSSNVTSGTTAQSITFPANSFANGIAYDWSVQTIDMNGSSAFPPDNTVNGQATPSVTVSSPSGTVADVQPTIEWVAGACPGAVQIAYRVCIYSAAQYGASGFSPGVSTATFDSGLIGTNATSWTPSGLLGNSATYRAYVQITMTGSTTSPWEYIQFTTAATTLATPTLTVTTGVDANGCSLNTLVVQGADTGEPVGNTTASINYSDDGGATWWPLRYGQNIPLPSSTQRATILDSEAPPGFTRDYQAVVQWGTGYVSAIAAPGGGAPPVHDPLRWQLVDFLAGDSMLVSLQPGTFDTDYDDRQNVVDILGRTDPVVLSDTFGLPQLTFTLIFTSDSAYQHFEAMRSRQHILLFKGPNPTGQWYIRLGQSKHDSLNLPSVRGYSSLGTVIRTINFTAQAVGTP